MCHFRLRLMMVNKWLMMVNKWLMMVNKWLMMVNHVSINDVNDG